MRLFLVRHGESVDNVAGLYAGSRDSALTAHGVLQARRLGAHLAARALAITHIFSSDLQRASMTASAICDAQTGKDKEEDAVAGAASARGPGIVESADLRERDFRSGEGVRFGGGHSGSGGRSAFADAETRDEMRVRAERFLDGHLHPLLTAAGQGAAVEDGEADDRRAVVVVAHGLILNVLLSSLLQRYAPAELARLLPSARLLPPARGGGAQAARYRRPELRVPWNNTGFVDMAVDAGVPEDGGGPGATSGSKAAGARVRLRVTAVNCVEHLDGLKKTQGGIGSTAFDAKQKTMDDFFAPAAKRQKKGG